VPWLVLCALGDEAGRWAFDGLRGRATDPVELVTDADLVGAAWEHRIGEAGVASEVRLGDGRTLRSNEIRGTLNRLTHAPPALTGLLAPADREYGYAEYSALLLSWLAALDGPILNPPTTRGLCGAWRSNLEWASLAAEAGLACVPVEADSDDPSDLVLGQPRVDADRARWEPWPPGASIIEDAIVVGDTVFSARRLDRASRDACRRLAVLAGTPILGLVFAPAERNGRAGMPPRLRGATSLPDLRAGGEPLLSALADTLRTPATQPQAVQ
jgi:hypothetical protein